MNKNHLATLITVAFFVGTFLVAFSSPDSDVAAMRIMVFYGVTCSASLVAIFWDKIQAFKDSKTESKMDVLLNDPQKFSNEYGDIYVMADKMKAKRRIKNSHHAISH